MDNSKNLLSSSNTRITTNISTTIAQKKLGVFSNAEELIGLKADEIDYYVHYEAHDRYVYMLIDSFVQRL